MLHGSNMLLGIHSIVVWSLVLISRVEGLYVIVGTDPDELNGVHRGHLLMLLHRCLTALLIDLLVGKAIDRAHLLLSKIAPHWHLMDIFDIRGCLLGELIDCGEVKNTDRATNEC